MNDLMNTNSFTSQLAHLIDKRMAGTITDRHLHGFTYRDTHGDSYDITVKPKDPNHIEPTEYEFMKAETLKYD